MNKKSMLRMSYALLLLVATVPTDSNATCDANIVSNPDFTDGRVVGSMPSGQVTDWAHLTASPQVIDAGCDDDGALQMWGNLTVGESIYQQLPGAGIQAGKTYSIRVCYRWLDNNNPQLPQYVRFRLAATNTALGYPAASGFPVIGTTPNTSSTTFITHVFPNWVAPANYQYLTVNPENDQTENDGAFVSWGVIDNICIELVEPVGNSDASWGAVKALF